MLAGSLLHLNTSQGEGWGLCVLEAAALGVPTVAYDVDGLRDAVRDGETGWLVRDGELIEDVTERAVKELADPARRAAVAAACRGWAGAARAGTGARPGWRRWSGRPSRPGPRGLATAVPGSCRDGDVAEGPALDRLLRHGGGTLGRPAPPVSVCSATPGTRRDRGPRRSARAGPRPGRPAGGRTAPRADPAGRVLPAADGAPVRHRARPHHRRHQARPGHQPGGASWPGP